MLPEKIGESPADLDVRLLEDVVGVDAAGQPAVDTEADHPPQPFTIAVEQLGKGRLVAAASPQERRVGIDRVRHGAAR